MVSAGTALAGKLKNHITAVQCVQHRLNYALKEPNLGKLIQQCKEVVQYTGTTAPRAIYNASRRR